MGAIQNSLNQITGAVGQMVKTAAVISKYGEMEQEQGLLAKEQFHEAGADLTKLSGESKAAEEALSQASAVKTDAGEFMRAIEADSSYSAADKTEAGKMYKKALTEQKAAQRAFDELQDRIEAKKAMQARAEKIMNRTSRWGGMK